MQPTPTLTCSPEFPTLMAIPVAQWVPQLEYLIKKTKDWSNYTAWDTFSISYHPVMWWCVRLPDGKNSNAMRLINALEEINWMEWTSKPNI
jgi:hypothetical protein